MVQMTPADQAVVKAIPGNTGCSDCGMKNPQWASVSFGNVFCLECSGVHRYVVRSSHPKDHRRGLETNVSSHPTSLVLL